jgi:aldose 1-epimerase
MGLMRSGVVTGLFLAIVLLGVTAGYVAHMRGNFHKLKAKMDTERQDAPVPRPGGEDAIVLVRSLLMGDARPEFLSATLLPGRGMNVLQITAYIPGRGEVNLLASPALEIATKAMIGTGADANGQTSLTLGSPFEVPCADGVWGTTTATGHIASAWRARVLNLPDRGAGVSTSGLLLASAADSVNTTTLPDGGGAQAIYNANDFGGRWPSKTVVTVNVLLNSRSIELTVKARNAGDVAEPIGIGWRPRFAILDGDRQRLKLHVPGQMRVETSGKENGLPTGRLVPVTNTPYDFNATDGVSLATTDLNACFGALHENMLDDGPAAELSDPVDHYGLRITALSSSIKAMCVAAPANGDYVSIEPQFNYPDPFGREWAKEPNTGMVVLQPGESTEWKVRLDLVSPTRSDSEM